MDSDKFLSIIMAVTDYAAYHLWNVRVYCHFDQDDACFPYRNCLLMKNPDIFL